MTGYKKIKLSEKCHIQIKDFLKNPENKYLDSIISR